MSDAMTAPNEIRWAIHDTHPDLVPALRAKLAEVVDPEIGLNVLQLGLIRKVEVEGEIVKLYVILTTHFCPYGPAMIETIRQKAQEAANKPVNIEMGMEMWDFSMMEDPGVLDWGLYA